MAADNFLQRMSSHGESKTPLWKHTSLWHKEKYAFFFLRAQVKGTILTWLPKHHVNTSAEATDSLSANIDMWNSAAITQYIKGYELSNAIISKSHASKLIAIYSNQESSNILLSSIDEDKTQKRITQQSEQS